MKRLPQVVLIVPLALLLSVFLVLPALYGLITSFTDYSPGAPAIHLVGLANYAEVFGDSQFLPGWRNISLFVVVAVPVELALGLLGAYLLRGAFRGRGLLRLVLLLPWLISPVANGVMWHFLYSQERGIPGYALALLGSPGLPSPLGLPSLALPAAMFAEIWRQTPLAIFLLLPGMAAIPSAEWELAEIEGASFWFRMRNIALPGLRTLIATVAMLLVGTTLGIFDSILVLTGGGPGSATMVPGLFSYKEAFGQSSWPSGVASAWIIAAVVLFFGFIYFRWTRDRTEAPRSSPVVVSSGMRHPLTWVNGMPGLTQSRFKRAYGQRTVKRIRRAATVLVLAVLVIVMLLPIFWTLLASFNIKPENTLAPPTWNLAPTFQNYSDVDITEPGYLHELMVSTMLGVATSVLTVAIALAAAYGLRRSAWRGKKALLPAMLILACLPVMAYVMPLTDTVKHLGLYDTFAGVTLAESAALVPLAVFVLWGYVSQVPSDLEDAARLDGANTLQIIGRVVMPVAAAGIAATGIIIFVLSWNQFLLPLTLSTDQVRGIPMAMVDVFKWDRELEWSAVAAAFIGSLLPLLILVAATFPLLERFSLIPTEIVS